MSFRQLRGVGNLSPASCLGMFASFCPLTDITIDSTRSSSAMSVGDVSVTGAKCTSEKVRRP